jgi:hypothetical protein
MKRSALVLYHPAYVGFQCDVFVTIAPSLSDVITPCGTII